MRKSIYAYRHLMRTVFIAKVHLRRREAATRERSGARQLVGEDPRVVAGRDAVLALSGVAS